MTDIVDASATGSDQRGSRRDLLKLAGATVAGGAALTLAQATPAGAADGDPVNIGEVNTGTAITFLTSTISDNGPALSVARAGTGEGPDLKLNGTGRLAQRADLLTTNAQPTFQVIADAVAGTDPAHEIVRSNSGLIWASTGTGVGASTLWKRINTVRVDTASGSGAAFAPFRFIDTRDGTGGISGARSVGGTTNWNVTAHASIPDDAIGIMGNLTVTGGNYSGWVTLWPRGVAEPISSSVNFTSGQTIANFFCVGLGTGANAGQISIGPRKSGTQTGSTHIVLDITAYIQ